MRRVLSLSLLLMTVLLTGCGQVFVNFTSNPQIPSSSTSGTITVVVLRFTNDLNGNQVTLTTVTFLNNGFNSSFNFCGDQRQRFPIDQVVRANFTPGNVCDNLVTVVLLN
jgi:hypothetical protein